MKISIKEEQFGIPIKRKRKNIIGTVLLIIGMIALSRLPGILLKRFAFEVTN